MAKLTKRVVDSAEARGRDYFIWCDELPRFGLRVFGSGRKSYVVQYRDATGRSRRVALGSHGPLTTDQARKKALAVLADVAQGGNPAEQRAVIRQDITVAELCDLWMVEGIAHLKPSSVPTYRSAIEHHIKPSLGRRRLHTLTGTDIEKFQADVAAGRTAADLKTGPRGRARVAGGRTVAARATAYLASILSFAVRRRLLTANPARGVRLFPTERRERFLSQAELARLGEALVRAEQSGANASFVAAVKLLLMTGMRKNEVLRLRWSEVDIERACVRLNDSKTGRKTIPLGAAALDILASLPRNRYAEYVLPAARGTGPATGLQKFWDGLRRQADLADVRLHDCRHAFASVAVAGGDSLFLVGKLLGHRQARTAERYAHVADSPLRAVADRASRQIATAMGRPETDVLTLRRKP